MYRMVHLFEMIIYVLRISKRTVSRAFLFRSLIYKSVYIPSACRGSALKETKTLFKKSTTIGSVLRTSRFFWLSHERSVFCARRT